MHCLSAPSFRSCWLALAVTVGLSMIAGGSVAADAPASASSAAPTDRELAGTNCAIGEERFLPGDYYYCLGTQTYGQQHYEYAKKFFDEAAGWGSKPAQYVLAVMALNGDHQPVNRPLALAWLTLAAERPDSRFKQAYAQAWAASTANDRAAADRLLGTMRPVYADATAAVRAEKRYVQGMAELSRKDAGGGTFCLEGMTSIARASGDPASCPPVQTVVQQIDRAAANVFDGWSGHVTVGPLQQVNAASVGKKGG